MKNPLKAEKVYVTDHHDRSMIAASCYVLTEELPYDFLRWDEDKIDSWIVSRVSEQYEYYESDYLWDAIGDIASGMRSFFESESKL